MVYSIGTSWMWAGFLIFVGLMLWIDLFLLGGRKAKPFTVKEAITWSIVWVTLALTFNFLLWRYLNTIGDPVIAHQRSLEFLTGYLIEKSLSVDNLFVFFTIFAFFKVPLAYQRRVLVYGVIGAVFLRMIMILAGVALINQFHWVLYLFGIFLVYSGIALLFSKEEHDIKEGKFLRFLLRYLPITKDCHEEAFFVRKNHKLFITPLFLVLIYVEISDVIFALDSVPAIFAITLDPFIVFTSNIFAILGLRALYFLLAHMALRFYLLKYGVALMLTFVGVEMLIKPWIVVPIHMTLIILVMILITAITLSLVKRPQFRGSKHGNPR